VTVAGQDYEWTGDVPNIPQIDFQVKGEQVFDAWGFDPGATVSSKTEPVTIIQVGVGDLVGASIPGIDGGIEVNMAMELDATYKTQRMVIETTDGQPVAGGDITAPDGESSTKYLNGPAVDLDVHPEGTVDYDGVLHLIPAFWVELLGKSWSIPIADIPITFPITQTEWIFDKQRVHVPLPDVVVSVEEIDFGDVQVGQKSLESFNVWNAGEARAKVTFVSSNPDVFPAWDPTADVESGLTFDSGVRFMPIKNGPFEATLFVASNDPNDAVQKIILKGVGFGGPEENVPPTIEETGGCACRVADNGSSRSSEGAIALLGLGTVLSMVRRARRVKSDLPGSN
jgi:MYXO-CTERM domain-containing protein